MSRESLKARDRLIVALDVNTRDQALALVGELDGLVSFFKVGYQLFLSEGLPFVRELIQKNKRTFLDLKMNDIEETIRLAVGVTAAIGVEFLTIHGNAATARAAREGRGAHKTPKILYLTLLSSLDASDLQDSSGGATMKLNDHVKARARQALDNGSDGLIASGETIGILRSEHHDAIIVSPGIRPSDAPHDDHKRACTPAEAIRAGADYLVTGRPIRNASNRRLAAERIISEIEEALG
jgi:orotidine-5'-phosphate decarboxylase